jgi:hypothetical protein
MTAYTSANPIRAMFAYPPMTWNQPFLSSMPGLYYAGQFEQEKADHFNGSLTQLADWFSLCQLRF